MSIKPLYQSQLKELKLLHRGKVRDIYEVDARHLLIVSTDRISAFDVIMPTPIPEKGQIINKIANFWFHYFASVIDNQLTDISVCDVIHNQQDYMQIKDQAVVVKKLKALPVEAIVRGYIIGSGWKDYQRDGQICGISLPPGLQLAQQLPQPIYTPSSKAKVGEHDENICFEDTQQLLGKDIAAQIRDISLTLYQQAAEYARKRGMIIADTKFEFGLDEDGHIVLIDEVLTPDSSRFWDAAHYQIGISPPSYDKQYVRDYLQQLVQQGQWNKQAPGPQLPQQIVTNTTAKYHQASHLLLS